MQAEELLKEVRRIKIRTNRIVEEVIGGEYHSAFKGRGLEFSEVREYVAEDDIRSIDWNVTARMGSPYVKRFVEERELTIQLLVDVSDSMDFGTGNRLKRETCAEISGLLGFSAIKNNDRIGLIGFSKQIEQYIPPRKGVRSVLRVVRDLLELRGAGVTDISVALEHLMSVQRRRAVVFLISDFHATGFENTLKMAAMKYDLIPVWVDGGLELNPPRGMISMLPLEDGKPRMVDFGSRRIREAYIEAVMAHRERLSSTFSKLGLDYISVTAGTDMYHSFRRFFEKRKRRMIR